MGSGNERIALLVFSPSAVCASSQITSWYASRESVSWWRANHAYVWIVSGLPSRNGSLPRSIGGEKRSPYPSSVKIGRASCRERGEVQDGAVASRSNKLI